MRVYAEWICGEQFDWMSRSLRRIRRATGGLRDLDVLVADVERSGDDTAPLLAPEFQRRRGKARRKITRLGSRLDPDQLARRGRRLVRSIGPPAGGGNRDAASWNAETILRFVQSARQRRATGASSLSQLHRFRIRLKRLRYALELLDRGFQPNRRARLLERLKQLQQRLGRLHDHAVASQFFLQWRNQESDPAVAAAAERQHRRAERQLQQSRRDFARWWTAAKQRQLFAWAESLRGP
jgi:CHAD domain-containing protein